MTAKQTRLRRLQLDGQFAEQFASQSAAQSATQLPGKSPELNNQSASIRPPGGWIKAIRESLGMSLDVFARRLGLASRSTAFQLEKAEVAETITIKRLRAAADVLNCELQIRFVPRTSLTETVERRAREKATYELNRVAHSMVMEQQAIYGERLRALIEERTQEILAGKDSNLWK